MATSDLLANVLPRLKELVSEPEPDRQFEIKLLSQQFIDGVAVFFMLDRGDHYEYVSTADAVDLDDRQVLAAAVANFERLAVSSDGSVLQLETDAWMLTGLRGLESSALLAPDYMRAIGFDPDRHGCAVPVRDTFLWFSLENKDAVALVANAAQTAYEEAQPSERVTAKLLVHSNEASGRYVFWKPADQPRRGWMGRLFGAGRA
jgi:hypothetical protein